MSPVDIGFAKCFRSSLAVLSVLECEDLDIQSVFMGYLPWGELQWAQGSGERRCSPYRT